MTLLTHAKLGLAASGLMIWGYGVKSGEPLPTWLGIGMLALAATLRFFRPRSPEP